MKVPRGSARADAVPTIRLPRPPDPRRGAALRGLQPVSPTPAAPAITTPECLPALVKAWRSHPELHRHAGRRQPLRITRRRQPCRRAHRRADLRRFGAPTCAATRSAASQPDVEAAVGAAQTGLRRGPSRRWPRSRPQPVSPRRSSSSLPALWCAAAPVTASLPEAVPHRATSTRRVTSSWSRRMGATHTVSHGKRPSSRAHPPARRQHGRSSTKPCGMNCSTVALRDAATSPARPAGKVATTCTG